MRDRILPVVDSKSFSPERQHQKYLEDSDNIESLSTDVKYYTFNIDSDEQRLTLIDRRLEKQTQITVRLM